MIGSKSFEYKKMKRKADFEPENSSLQKKSKFEIENKNAEEKKMGIVALKTLHKWSGWIDEKRTKNLKKMRKKEDNFVLQTLDEIYLQRDTNTPSLSDDALKDFEQVFEAYKALARQGVKLTVEQYECYRTNLQFAAKKKLGQSLLTHYHYLAKKYGFFDYNQCRAFIMGRFVALFFLWEV